VDTVGRILPMSRSRLSHFLFATTLASSQFSCSPLFICSPFTSFTSTRLVLSFHIASLLLSASVFLTSSRPSLDIPSPLAISFHSFFDSGPVLLSLPLSPLFSSLSWSSLLRIRCAPRTLLSHIVDFLSNSSPLGFLRFKQPKSNLIAYNTTNTTNTTNTNTRTNNRNIQSRADSAILLADRLVPSEVSSSSNSRIMLKNSRSFYYEFNDFIRFLYQPILAGFYSVW
jgi:hypothetical protein